MKSGLHLVGRSVAERLTARLDMSESDACWEYQGGRNGNNYGTIGDGPNTLATHRVAYEVFIGPIPTGLGVLHHCDNPPCCNPRHLYVGTQADNARDRDARGRRRAPKGELNGRVKLTDVQVAELRDRASAGVNKSELARTFGIGRTQVGRLVRGESR